MGRPEFSLPGTKDSPEKVGTQRAPNLEVITEETATSLAADAIETVEIYAPTDQWYEVQSARLHAPNDATWLSGSHKYWLVALGEIQQMLGESNYGANLSWRKMEWESADSRQMPSNGSAAVSALTSLIATDTQPLVINYQPSTDAAQDEKRLRKFIMEKNQA